LNAKFTSPWVSNRARSFSRRSQTFLKVLLKDPPALQKNGENCGRGKKREPGSASVLSLLGSFFTDVAPKIASMDSVSLIVRFFFTKV
jgi:hypothetical protein